MLLHDIPRPKDVTPIIRLGMVRNVNTNPTITHGALFQGIVPTNCYPKLLDTYSGQCQD